MKSLAFSFLTFLTISSLFSQTIDSSWVVKNYTKQEVTITMRDGVKLFTSIYRPNDQSEKHPILLVRTPYSVAPYGSAYSPRLYAAHWSQYLREGYILVLQDVRGCYMSEGEFVDVRPFVKEKKKKTDIDEASDAYDTIDWLIANVANNNGNVGCFGISYPGFYATMTALSGHPALKAVSPQAPVTDWYMGDDFHHNGTFALMDAFSFYSGFGRPRPTLTTQHKTGFPIPGKDNYDFFLKTGAIKNFSKLLGDSIAFWKDLCAHPNMDAFWTARDARKACYNIKPAVLVVGGTFDAEDCFGAWNLYKAIEEQNKNTSNRLVMGPWFHGGWSRGEGAYLGNIRFGAKTATYYQQSIELPFFNFYLKGKGQTTNIPEATVFFSGENNWKKFDQWPARKVSMQNYFLRENQRLSTQAPTEAIAFSSYTSDPLKPVPYTEDVHTGRTREYMDDDQRFAARRPDVLVYEMELTEDLCLAGPVVADLQVSLSTSDADFVVKIIDVFPNNFHYDDSICCKGVAREAEMAGYQMLVRAEIFRGRYRNGFDQPSAFVPGKTEHVKFNLPDIAHTFKKGHKLMIQVQSSWFPLFDRNPQQFVNIYTCSDDDFVPCTVKILQQKDAASFISLPVIPN